MSVRTLVTATVLAVMFSVNGSSNFQLPEAPRLTQEQVIRIAEETAKAEGYDIVQGAFAEKA